MYIEIQGRFLFSRVTQPVAHQWPLAGHSLTDWQAATLQLAAEAVANRTYVLRKHTHSHFFHISMNTV